MPERTVKISLLAEVGGFVKGLGVAANKLVRFAGRVSRETGKVFAGVGMMGLNVAKKLVGALTGALSSVVRFATRWAVRFAAVVAGAIGYIGVSSIKAASMAEETQAKFETVFGRLTKEADVWAVEFADAVGVARVEVKGFLAQLQDTFVPLGFAEDKAYDFSKAIVTLSVDLASFNPLVKTTDEAIRDVTSALVGNHETVRKYGVILDEASIKTWAMKQGIVAQGVELTNQQKVLARLNIIMDASTKAQGDAIRTSGSFKNQLKRLGGEWTNLKGIIGSFLIKEGTWLVKSLGQTVKGIRLWIEANRELIQQKVDAFVEGVRDKIKAMREATEKAVAWLAKWWEEAGAEKWEKLKDGIKDAYDTFVKWTKEPLTFWEDLNKLTGGWLDKLADIGESGFWGSWWATVKGIGEGVLKGLTAGINELADAMGALPGMEKEKKGPVEALVAAGARVAFGAETAGQKARTLLAPTTGEFQPRGGIVGVFDRIGGFLGNIVADMQRLVELEGIRMTGARRAELLGRVPALGRAEPRGPFEAPPKRMGEDDMGRFMEILARSEAGPEAVTVNVNATMVTRETIELVRAALEDLFNRNRFLSGFKKATEAMAKAMTP